MTKTTLQIISILELFLLITIGILSNKISEIIQINQVVLWGITVLVVLLLVAITVYKNRLTASSPSPIPNSNLKITKKTVRSVLTGMIYYPSALLMSKGAFAYSLAIDNDWLGILSGSAISGTLLFTPLFLNLAKEERQNIIPLTIGFLLSAVYGTIGLYIDLSPKFFDSNLFTLAMLSAATFVGLKYVYLYYTFFAWFDKWFKQLPET